MLNVIALARAGLEPASFSLDAGECIAVRGPSGAGKTLLLRAIADLDPNQGRLLLDGRDRDAMPAPEWRRQVMYLPAHSGWWHERVGAHFPDWDRAAALLGTLGLPADAADWPVSRCSTGELARLALARALLADPKVLLLDEPTGMLDAQAVAAVERLLLARMRAGVSLLWVTHDTAQAGRVARRTLFVTAGRVREGEIA